MVFEVEGPMDGVKMFQIKETMKERKEVDMKIG